MFKECMENIDTDVVVYGVNPFNSQIKFVILVTVKHTVLIMFVKRI